jgi:NADPH-dependent 7-cyano-7-deazaguanine reductase QueF
MCYFNFVYLFIKILFTVPVNLLEACHIDCHLPTSTCQLTNLWDVLSVIVEDYISSQCVKLILFMYAMHVYMQGMQ